MCGSVSNRLLCRICARCTWHLWHPGCHSSQLSPLFLSLFTGFAVWMSGEAEKVFNKKDSGLIVIDEMAGFLVALFLIPWSVKSVVIGFFLFRLIDIAKPFPIRILESKLPGGWGVVGDDLLAGIYVNTILRVINVFF
jgi:phosphatidylglycerophosphatase A